jgi:hypothetical protein
MQRRIQAAMLNLEKVAGTRPDHLPDSVAMLRAPPERPQDQQVECALQDVEFVSHVVGILPPL